ncbi:hypothetical protein [Nostoc sp. 'Peltigera malacea cyanobiont' DB3992]|uniref:hypothetical protein n=1 Tax=Nostoc sp. 'Peltigera malacea cyanobiont' DB3992 TaxID=1206980 RepID=UPI0015D502E8|nr:hypothetical protein [Nostoc sp. 'Peltigera malacea cyanobiont' DB3992]
MVRLPSPVGDATRTTALRASRSPAAQLPPARVENLDFALVRVGELCWYSRDF